MKEFENKEIGLYLDTIGCIPLSTLEGKIYLGNAKMLKLRFGLSDGQHRTLEEVGEVFNVAKERVRQIEAKSIAELKRKKLLEIKAPIMIIQKSPVRTFLAFL